MFELRNTTYGRGLYATVDIKSGTKLAVCHPYSTAVTCSFTERICANCGLPSGSKHLPTNWEIVCQSCHSVRYCSTQCQLSHTQHAVECEALQRFNENEAMQGLAEEEAHGDHTHSQARLLISILCRAAAEPPCQESPQLSAPPLCCTTSDDNSPHSFAEVETLEGNSRVLNPELNKAIDTMWQGVETALPTHARGSKEAFSELVLRDECNGFAYWKGGECYGCSIIPRASMFNHSCTPNVVKAHGTGWRMTFTTLRNVPAGTELCISYVGLDALGKDRRESLRDQFGFDCQCVKCEREKQGREKVRVCAKCLLCAAKCRCVNA